MEGGYSGNSSVAPGGGPGEGAGGPGRDDLTRGNYRDLVASALVRHKYYPAIARRRGDEGVVTLRLVVDRSGRLVTSSIIRVEGSNAFGAAALDMAEKASPFPAVPPNLEGSLIELRIPVRFRLVE
jgi:protein TonB